MRGFRPWVSLPDGRDGPRPPVPRVERVDLNTLSVAPQTSYVFKITAFAPSSSFASAQDDGQGREV